MKSRVMRLGLTSEELREGLDRVATIEPAVARALERVGYPEPRTSAPGYGTLLRTIVGQQVSVAAARSIWNKLEQAVGPGLPPDVLLSASDERLREAGLSRQKISYARSLAGQVATGTLDLERLPEDDEQAVALLTGIKGIGRWSAEIYLLFAEGRPDIWPAGDLAVQVEIGRIMGLEARPSERQTRELAHAWKPYRGAMAILSWHHYKTKVL